MTAALGASAHELFREGRLAEAITQLGATLRAEPSDRSSRMFLFELLLLQGDWTRAALQLSALTNASPDAELTTLTLSQALESEQARAHWFQFGSASGEVDASDAVNGSINDATLNRLSDSDPRVGARLEAFHMGRYLRIPFRDIASIRLTAPTQLWHTIWAPAMVHLHADLRADTLGRVLLPVRSWGTELHLDAAVRDGTMTVWEEEHGIARPYGQKVLEYDAGELALLDIRTVDLRDAPALAS
jgi:type VI secretion system protein ImpE